MTSKYISQYFAFKITSNANLTNENPKPIPLLQKSDHATTEPDEHLYSNTKQLH